MARVWRTQVDRHRAAVAGDDSCSRCAHRDLQPHSAQHRPPVSTAADFSTVTRAPIPLTKTGAFYFATFTTFTPNELFTVAGIVSFPDLSITKTAPAAMVAGANATYALTVTNTSTVFASDAVVSDILPSSLTFVSSTPACSASGQTVTCALSAMSPGQTMPIALTVRVAPDVPAGTVIQNTASVTHADARIRRPPTTPATVSGACRARRARI